ncbi:hypothetical protein AVEN_21905-1 [Araneus ventricosus]|uniref:DDE-1 domain-containing protein n=1 Tax=Araneus ventricosus TaxID=182803 RepID=A0A4Y2D4U5_ARAVE|nr:hypothetical protein AVEN_21905-1 [Araneus ventricosus]
MTEIMSDWLVDLDKRMKKQARKILFFLDNATSHPDNLKVKIVKLVLFWPNTTPMLQPLDQGIIYSFKAGYRKLLLRQVLSQIFSCKSSEESAKSVSVLDAVSWIMSDLKKVESGSILKCFKKARFASVSNAVHDSATDENEMDSNVRVEDYVEIDKDLWIEKEDLNVTNFIPQNTTRQFALSDDKENDFPVNEDDVCKIKGFSEALRYSEELKKFFLCKGDSEGFQS